MTGYPLPSWVTWNGRFSTSKAVFGSMPMAVHLAETVDNALVNIGAGAEFSIREFARLICDL
ncbi:MAG TPA: hypothetical protein VKG78_06655, partial [Opitutaceae bacterium]|nr:hypothetical protein [Opitutaceae bacterium]